MKKKLILLFGVFTITGLVAAVFYVRSHSGPRNTNPLQSVGTDKIGTIRMWIDGSTVTLVHTDLDWRVISPYKDWGDSEIIDPLVGKLTGLAVQSVVSENPDRYGQFELDEKHARRVQVVLKGSDDPVFDGYFGKMATGYDSAYFRFADDKPVRMAFGLPGYLLRQAPDSYREARVLPLDWNKSDQIRLRGKNKNLELVRSSNTWVITGSSSSANDLIVSRLVTILRHFRVKDYPPVPPAPDQTGLTSPELTIDVRADGKNWTASIGRASSGGKGRPWFGQTGGRDVIYTLRDTQVKSLIEQVDALLGSKA